MHHTNMFQQPAAPAAAQVQVYDINQIAQNFAGWNFNVGQPYDQYTPQIAVMTIREIQGHALKGHPIRVGMFNIISENAFDNASFQDLVYTIIMRVAHGITNGEWRNYDQAVANTIARAVKACGSYMAACDAEFMATLPANEQKPVQDNAAVWEYLMALAQGQAQFVPFAQMDGSGLSTVATSTQAALNDARVLRGSNAGAFVEAGDYEAVTSTRYNNNAHAGVGKYARRAQHIHGKVEGSMQGALAEAGLAGGTPPAPYQSRMSRPNARPANAPAQRVAPQAATVAAAQRFDSDVTDFSKPLDTTAVAEPTQAPTPAPSAAPLFTVQVGTETVEIIRQVKEGFEKWKPSRLQRFHPAWCKRTHTPVYFETKDGLVMVVLQELTDKQKAIAMNYDAHAIDPTKGQPEPQVPVKPVREEAKVLYTDASNVKINVVVAKVYGTEEDVAGAIRSARVAAEMSETVPDAFVKMSLVNAPVIYPTAEEAADDLIIMRAIANSKDFAEAASYLPKVRNEMASKIINRTLVKAVNRAIECQMGIGIRIGDFIEDGPAIIDYLEKKQGSLIGERMRAEQSAILKANVCVLAATDEAIRSYADATLSPEDEVALTDAVAQRVLFLQHTVCAVWVNFTDNEMAIGIPPKGAVMIEGKSLGGLYAIAKSAYVDGIGKMNCAEQYLITKDSVTYSLHKGLLSKDCYLLSQKVA
jgi:hypothetical protein